ncbi:MAG TPA: glycosyltransferase family 39 protein, partial [Chloroflexia bacterium]|nr:glycosyltransferase family 39 protein [Chloroflexia bacterium]
MTRLRVGIGLGLVLLVAAALRIPSHNWDQDQHLHTDERYVTRVTIDRVQLPPGVTLATLLDAQHSPIDPRAAGQLYTYGALPIYLGKAATVLALAVSGDSYFSSYNGTQQTGRVLAGLFDILTTLLVFAAGRRLWGAGAGLRAAALYALAVLPIQIGHFYIAEPFMTTFMTATLLGSLTYYHTRRALPLLLAALCAGLATACKLQAAPILALPLITLFLHPGVGGWGLGVGGRERGWGWRVGGQASSERTGHRSPVTGHSSPNPKSKIQNPKSVGPKLLALLVLGLAGLGLLLGDPFAVLDAPTYLAQVSDQAAIQSGASDAFFTRQYVGTWPVLYPWGQLLLLGAGPVAGLVATGRLLAGLRRGTGLSRPAAGPALVLLAGGGLYFASIAFLEAKWLRYLLPLVPYLCLVAAAPFTWRILPEVQSRTLSPEGRGQGEGGIVPQPRGAGLDPVAIYGRIGVAGLLI